MLPELQYKAPYSFTIKQPYGKKQHNKAKNRNKPVNPFLPFTKTINIFQFFILHQIFTKHLFSMHAARYPVLKVRVKC